MLKGEREERLIGEKREKVKRRKERKKGKG